MTPQQLRVAAACGAEPVRAGGRCNRYNMFQSEPFEEGDYCEAIEAVQ